MSAISITPVRPDQLPLLQQIGRQTFVETFSAMNTAENMRRYLDASFSLERLEGELTNPDTRFYFAWSDQTAIGYLKVNFGPAQSDLRDERALEIERIYVRQSHQGLRAGQALFEHAIKIARDALLDYIWLGVWEENHKAIRFYQKQGLTVFDKHVFVIGDDAQTDLLMKLVL